MSVVRYHSIDEYLVSDTSRSKTLYSTRRDFWWCCYSPVTSIDFLVLNTVVLIDHAGSSPTGANLPGLVLICDCHPRCVPGRTRREMRGTYSNWCMVG